jgi:hypothetical protein
MKLEIANETRGIVHVALYKKSMLRPSEPPVAWAIVSPPPRGRAIFSVPRDYRVFARYSFSPEDPWQPVYQTNVLPLHRNHDSLALQEISLGRSAWGAILARNVRKTALGELRIENNFTIGAWCHVQLGEHDVHPPRLLSPHGVLIEALASPFFLAVVSPLARAGAPLAEHEIRATEVELADGKGGVFTVHRTTTQGYRIAPGAPSADRVKHAKEAVASPRAKPKKAPRTPKAQPKTRAKPNADTKKRREAARKRAKKTAHRRPGLGKTTKKAHSASFHSPLSDQDSHA